jgi:transposase InsO family protein
VNEGVLSSLHKHVANFRKVRGTLQSCHSCALGKAKRKCFTSHFTRASVPGEVVHSDVVGPLPTSTTGAKWLCTFIDQASRYTNIACLVSKADVSKAHDAYSSSQTAAMFPSGIQRLHTDRGGEYEPVVVHEHTTTTPHTPQHNPFAERANRTIFEPVRTLLEETAIQKMLGILRKSCGIRQEQTSSFSNWLLPL